MNGVRTIPGRYFDGRTSKATAVGVRLERDALAIDGEGLSRRLPFATLEFQPPTGSIKGIVVTEDGAELHFDDADDFHRLLVLARPRSIERLAMRLEARYRLALGAMLIAVALIVWGVRDGFPALAKIAAEHLPARVETLIGDGALHTVDQVLTKPSRLPEDRQQGLRGRLAAVCAPRGCPSHQLLFRDSPAIGPNAFALPGGSIIVTDELVEVAHNDDEILAVLFHELGHVAGHHGVRLMLQSAGAAAVLVVITGDVSSISDTAAGLPSLLLQSGYQRDMEREADSYALGMLKASCIAPKRFADILTRISEEEEAPAGKGSKAGQLFSLLSSHPDTPSRIRDFQSERGCD